MVQQFRMDTQISLGELGNLSIGPGQAYFWANAQGLAPVYQGPLMAIGAYAAPLPLWAWEDGSNISNLINDSGWLQLSTQDPTYPTAPTGLPPGAVWNNGLLVSVIPGVTPNPAAPPVFFGSITAATMLSLGGGNLPLSNPGAGTFRLWNDGGVVSVA
jgi:hypothetical protein